jgi:sigma-E factor negative regulatory protein RseC
MGANKTIEHEGIVKEINKDSVVVNFSQISACSACHAKGVCGASSIKEQKINISKTTDSFQIGEKVTIILHESLGLKAVLVGYIIPLILFLAVLITLQALTINELIIGIASISSFIPYYFILFLLKNKIDKTFCFTIKKYKL